MTSGSATPRPWASALATREAMMDEAIRGGPPVTMAARMVTHFDLFVAHAGGRYERAEADLVGAQALLALVRKQLERGGWPHDYSKSGIHASPGCRACLLMAQLGYGPAFLAHPDAKQGAG